MPATTKAAHETASQRGDSSRSVLDIFKPLHDEHGYAIDEIDGAIPDGLTGTLYRNGPGRLAVGGSPVGHLFDGDGMLSMFAIDGESVRYRNRYVRTEHYLAGQGDAGGLPSRTCGGMKPGGIRANALRVPANVANTSVVLHAGELLAMWEGGRPFKIDRDTLETSGQHDFDGQLGKLQAFSAHPKADPRTGDLFNFGLDMIPWPRLRCYRIDPSGRMHKLATTDLPAPAFNHDFALTERHMVFVVDPLFIGLTDLPSALLGRTSIDRAIRYQPERGTTIALVPRDGGKARVLQTEAFMHFHVNNAYEEHGDTVVDVIIWRDDWDTITTQAHDATRIGGPIGNATDFGGDLVRLRITPDDRVIREDLLTVLTEFPQFDWRLGCQRHRYTYLTANFSEHALVRFPNALVKYDHDTDTTTTHQLPNEHCVSEPIFVPRHADAPEDDGWLLAVAYNPAEHRSRLLILDANDIEQDPLFIGHLPHHIPLGFHGTFTRRVADSVGAQHA